MIQPLTYGDLKALEVTKPCIHSQFTLVKCRVHQDDLKCTTCDFQATQSCTHTHKGLGNNYKIWQLNVSYNGRNKWW